MGMEAGVGGRGDTSVSKKWYNRGATGSTLWLCHSGWSNILSEMRACVGKAACANAAPILLPSEQRSAWHAKQEERLT